MMDDQLIPPASDAARSRSELIAAPPTVRRLIHQLDDAIKPAVVTEHETPKTRAIFQAVTAIV